MRSPLLSAAVIAASVLLTLSSAQSAATSNAESPNAPKSSSSSTVQNATAFDVLVGAAEAGNVDAMNLLGVLYTIGTQVPRDYSVAMRWFQKAADGGSVAAMSNLATIYLFGIGTSRDHAIALRWFARAAELGDVHSMYSVGVMAEKGLGTARDLQLARSMYLKAAEAGYAPAMVWISDDYAGGSSVQPDLIEAYAWLQVALASGLPDEMQIAALSKMEHFEARLGSKRREEARARSARLIALVTTLKLPEGQAPIRM